VGATVPAVVVPVLAPAAARILHLVGDAFVAVLLWFGHAAEQVWQGPNCVAAHLTPDACELGLTVALPEAFVMASPAGFEPATFRLEGGCSVH
jgi:hypothetical protein